MHTGLCLTFQNLDRRSADRDVYEFELQLASRAEEAGFDSVWTPEHHFTDYMLTPNVPQFLAWLAGRTESIRLGTMVTVLPWHDPVRVAESTCLLDHLSGGRAILGLGRGLGRVEFDGFQKPMNESRTRFVEYTEALLSSLESGVLEYDGKLYKQPRVELRPEPYATYKGRTFASAISPESMDIMARLGVGLLVIAQKPWDKVEEELADYRGRFSNLNSEEAPKPVMNVFVGVHEDPEVAQEIRDTYLQRYARSTVQHYEFDNVGFADIEGYEYYAKLAGQINKHGLERFNGFLADLQVWGTPDQVAKKLEEHVGRCNAGALLLAFSYGGMPFNMARDNFDLFSKEVLPAIKSLDVGGDIGVRHASPGNHP